MLQNRKYGNEDIQGHHLLLLLNSQGTEILKAVTGEGGTWKCHSHTECRHKVVLLLHDACMSACCAEEGI